MDTTNIYKYLSLYNKLNWINIYFLRDRKKFPAVLSDITNNLFLAIQF